MEIRLPESSEQKNTELRLYSPVSERVYLEFNPLKMSDVPDWNPMWEEWHCYYEALRVYRQDYERLLLPFLEKLYPAKDAFSGDREEHFDVCSSNWLGKDDWIKFIADTENSLDTFSENEKIFYRRFIEWIKKALEYTDIIVVEGNQ